MLEKLSLAELGFFLSSFQKFLQRNLHNVVNGTRDKTCVAKNWVNTLLSKFSKQVERGEGLFMCIRIYIRRKER